MPPKEQTPAKNTNIEEAMQKLATELDNYQNEKKGFSEYYPDMNVLISPLYKNQLKAIIAQLEKENLVNAKSFQLYLDTVIINMHSKVKKYKKSIFFDDENIKDIENQGSTIPFYIDEKKNIYILLGILNPNI